MPQRFEITFDYGSTASGLAWSTGFGRSPRGQRHVKLMFGDTTVDVYVFGDDDTRQLMKALASASGGLLATLPDEPGPLGERDESALLAVVQGDHVGEGVAE